MTKFIQMVLVALLLPMCALLWQVNNNSCNLVSAHRLADSLDAFQLEAGRKYLLLQIDRRGFANRIRVLADISLMAALSNRVLIVSWQPTLDCNIRWEDLFESLPGDQIIMLTSHIPHGEEGKTYVENWIQNRPGASSIFVSVADLQKPSFLLNNTVLNGEEALVHTNINGVVAMEGVSCNLYMYSRTQFYNQIVFVSAIRESVELVMSSYFRDVIMIGIHYRDHDQLYDWNVVPPLHSAEAEKFGEGATLSDFLSIMTEINNFHARNVMKYNQFTILHQGENRENNPTLRAEYRFFVASNNESVKAELHSHFPDSIALRTSEATLATRGTPDAIQTAVVEWLLLSNSALLVNTHGSSFALEAAQVHGTPIVGIWNGHRLYQADMKMAYCGHLQFMRKYMSGVGTRRYMETGSNREVDGIQFEFAPCDMLKHMGLDDVLCAVPPAAV